MRTSYTIDISDGSSLILSIGLPNPELDLLLRRFQASSYAYLTAYNPNSTSLTLAENQLRHEQLCQDLEQRGFRYLTGRAIPDADTWEPEVCIFVFNMSRIVVQEVCQTYAQDGALVGDWGSEPKLLFTNPQLRADFLTLMNSCVLD
jgi:hypothetical protein